MKRFVITLENSTELQNKKFREYIQKRGYGWWHWLTNIWLLVTDDNTNAAAIRDVLMVIYPDSRSLVLEIPPGHCSWANFAQKESFNWLNDTWNK